MSSAALNRLATEPRQPRTEPVRVSLHGIEGLGRKSLSFLFSMQKHRVYQVVDQHPQAITIIDLDHDRGRTTWDQIKNDPSRQPVILLGLHPENTERDITLRKPFCPNDILTAVDRLLEYQENPVPRQEPAHKAAHCLAFRLRELTDIAARENKYLRLEDDGVTLYIDPVEKTFLTPAGENRLRTLAQSQDVQHWDTLEELPGELRNHGRQYPWNSFIWRMALSGCRGQLPQGTDMDRRFILARPLATGLMPIPHASRIADAWTTSPRSIREMLALSLPRRHVFTFFTAALASGYLREAETSHKDQAGTSSQARFPKSLILRMLRRFS